MKNNKDFSSLIKRNILSRSKKDLIPKIITYIFSSISLIVLVLVIGFVFINGAPYLSRDFITSEYSRQSVTLRSPEGFTLEDNYDFSDLERFDDSYYSEVWGVGFHLGEDNNRHEVIFISEVSSNSPFNQLITQDTSSFTISDQFYLSYLTVRFSDGSYQTLTVRDGLESFTSTLDKAVFIYDSQFLTKGGGIRNSLISTLLLILFTIIFSLPLGIGGAIYLGYYAKNNKVTHIIRTLVDMSSGIPSIIFGLVGAAIFIPLIGSMTSSNGGNVITGSLTMTLILLPTIVKTVEEGIKTIPKSYINGSLSLGASNFQTIFKIILPQSLEGILNALILSIGRTIGESAALVFAFGTLISSSPSLTSSSTTLAVHIWYILSGETPAYEQACAISIIIMIVILSLSLLSKLISIYFKRRRLKNVK